MSDDKAVSEQTPIGAQPPVSEPKPTGGDKQKPPFLGTKRLSPVPINPDTDRADPTKLAPHQEALRQAMLNVFTAQKARRSLERQVQHISPNRNLAEGIKILFDDKGQPPANVPLEDIVEERRRLEYHVKWFEGILAELRNRLVRVKEVEDYAFEMLSRSLDDE